MLKWWVCIGMWGACTMLFAQTSVGTVTTSAKNVVPKKTAKVQRQEMPASAMQALAVLDDEQMRVAERVSLGNIPCEFSNRVSISADPRAPGHFILEMGGQKFYMIPVTTSTGAIRLEDSVTGAVWLQLANKSMLMNQKLGKRLADACVTPEQLVVAQAMERSPAPNLLDGVKPSSAVVLEKAVDTVQAATAATN
jgi:hypothetical protein